MYDVTVIGCGVVGAAIAYELSKRKLRVLVLERENDVAMGTTKANSAIIHAGYDPEPGTLMARLNVEGCGEMERLCRQLSVEYRRIGSLVLAFDGRDMKTLERLYQNGVANGVEGLRILSAGEVRAMEPAVSEAVCGALYAPSCGIVDPWGLCIALAETAVRNGVELRLNSKVERIETMAAHYAVHTSAGVFESAYLVNCAGVHAHEISAMTGAQEWETAPTHGEYYLLDKNCGGLVKHVIFQCPSAAGKGVLVSPTVHGNLLAGPNAASVSDPDDHAVTAAGLAEIAAAGRKSVPSIDLRQSIRNFSGVRATTSEEDFIVRPSRHSPHMLHAAGIKSPGLSAAPALARYAVEQLGAMGLPLPEKETWQGGRTQLRFRQLSQQEKAALAARDPKYGRVICRCETITEGEILDALRSPIPPCSIDGVKRRTGAGMGRCQGGFCGPRVMEILSRELGRDPVSIPQDGDGTNPLTPWNQGGLANEV